MKSDELIQQINESDNINVINNPFIKAFLRLEHDKQEEVAAALSNNKVILEDNKGVDVLALLPCLWPRLAIRQKQDLISSVQHLFKGHGLRIADLISHEVDLIFADYDLKDLKWSWQATQTLLTRFSEEERNAHMARYFEKYYLPDYSYEKNPSLKIPCRDAWEAFLKPLSEEECYWTFMHLSFDDFWPLFCRIDFLFKFLSDKHKVSISQRINSELLFTSIENLNEGFSIKEKFTCFLQKFNQEDRKEVSLLLTREQLQSIIKNFVTLCKMLELFPETDRLDLLLYLGSAYLKERFLEGSSNNISFSLDKICKILPPHHRIPFLKSFTRIELESLNKDWPNIALVVNNLSSEEDAVFFEHLGHDVINPLIKKNIHSVIYPLHQEKRLSFLYLINRLFPGLLGEIFIHGKKANPYNFVVITKLLPKEEIDNFSFFALFSESDLRLLQAKIDDEKVSTLLRHYLQRRNSNRMLDNAAVPEAFGLPKNVTPTPFPLNRLSSKTQQEILIAPPCLSLPRHNTSPNYFRELDAKIEALASNTKESHQHLHDSLVELRTAIASQFARESSRHKNKPDDWERFSLKSVVDATIGFLNSFLNERSFRKKVKLIESYEHEIQPAKTLKTIGKCLSVFIIAALCGATGAAFGLALGLLLGCAITGPGGVVTGFAGLFAGSQAGIMVASVITGGVLAGVGGAVATSVAFFKPSPVERAKRHVVRDAEKIVREIESEHPYLR